MPTDRPTDHTTTILPAPRKPDPREQEYPCVACGQFVLHDRRLYETVGGSLRVAWKGRAHEKTAKRGGFCEGGFCEGGVRHDPVKGPGPRLP